MKKAAQMYAAFIAGVLTVAACAYWYWAEHMAGE